MFLWFLSTFTLVNGVILKAGRPAVAIGNGQVLGVEENHNGFTYYAFRAIPYAEPPVGELRFQDPLPSGGWTGDLDGATLSYKCTQRWDSTSSEDCLYVSVYTPKEAMNTSQPLAVLAYIHGGAFVFGGMSEPDPCHALVEKGVIVVALQYRLGILGFLSTEDDIAPGNLGLKDQTLALKWIKNNIASFGGDPDKITIFGESAGSYSVHYQMLVPSAAGLFRGVIMQSGTALNPGAHGRNFLQNAQDIALSFGCPPSPSNELIACLRLQPAAALIDMNNNFEEWVGHPRAFAPRVDGSYIPDEPLTLLKNGLYNHVPVIAGVNREEGAMYVSDWYANPQIIDSLLNDFETNGPLSMELLPDEDPTVTSSYIYDHYLPGLVIGTEQSDNAAKMHSHRYFHIPLDWATELMAPEVPVFLYELHHRGQYGHMDSYLQDGLNLPNLVNWISHADDLQYFFERFEWGPLITPDDLRVRDVFVTTWANFAKTLNPTPDDSLGVQWDRVTVGNLRHLVIVPTPVMEDDYRSTDRQFWNTLPLQENPYI